MLTKIMSMLSKQEQEEPTPSSAPPAAKSQDNYTQSAEDLMSEEHRKVLIRKIKRSFSVTDTVWSNHYLFALHRFAELAQGLPASEFHHHCRHGGLIDHTLETVHAGVRISQGYVLPPNTEPESLAKGADRWRFGVFIALLSHDLGKLVTDIEVVYDDGSGFQHWLPWFGHLPPGLKYCYRYRPKPENSAVAKLRHEQASMSMVPKLLTEHATRYLFEDQELIAQLFATISGATFGSGAIGEILKKADGASVSQDLGADTGKNISHSQTITLQEKIITSLRKLIDDGDLKRNKPGAAVWITDKQTWCVSKTAMAAVQAQLNSEGHKGIPKNPVRMFEVLREHGLIVANQHDESIWKAEVTDFEKNWQQQLTFLRFNNEVLFPTREPPSFFNGTVIVEGEEVEEEPVSEASSPVDPIPTEEIQGQQKVSSAPEPEVADQAIEPVTAATPQDPKPTEPKLKPETKKAPPKEVTVSNPPEKQQAPKKLASPPAPSEPKPVYRQKSQCPIEKKVKENDFIQWMLKGIQRGKVRVNETKAPVHVLDDHVAIVSPAIFVQYFAQNSLKRSLYEKKAEGKKIHPMLQKEIEGLGIHSMGINGQNIQKLLIKTEKSESKLSVYLLDRSHFPELSNFQSNKVVCRIE